jgi:sulfate transport system permease protein
MIALAANKRRRTLDSTAVRVTLIGGALLYVGVFLLLPLAAVFTEALAKGWRLYVAALTDPDALAAIRLTLATVAITVPLNAAFGLAAAWATTRFEFRGKELLITLIDLPLAVSPVISGLVYVLLFGMQGWLGPSLHKHDLQIIFAVPGIVLATVFVTFPFVARELIPFMQSQGAEQDEAASVLGAGGWSMFWRVTLPGIKWSLLYGVILCTARAMGEFGAVSVVSGHIRGETNTLPLQVEILYNEYNFTAAFALASILTVLALVTLIAKKLIECLMRRGRRLILGRFFDVVSTVMHKGFQIANGDRLQAFVMRFRPLQSRMIE